MGAFETASVLFIILIVQSVLCENETLDCLKHVCVRKCCPEGHAIINGSCFPANFDFRIHMDFPYTIVYGHDCSGANVPIEGFTEDYFTLENNGQLVILLEDDYNITTIIRKNYTDYCVDYFDNSDILGSLICTEVEIINSDTIYYGESFARFRI